MVSNVIFAFITLSLLSTLCSAGDIDASDSRKEDKCRSLGSCSSCLEKDVCTWCVTKSRCTQQACGNDNVIYPKNINALMSGASFCPRVVETDTSVYQSGRKEGFVVKITQIYLYMAFTPWKCKVNVDNKETVVNAVLLADEVYCQAVELKNESDNPYVSGSVAVLWNYDKSFDGSIPFKVCRVDLDPGCSAYPG